MTSAAVLASLYVTIAALAHAQEQRIRLDRERIRREEADAWSDQFEAEATALSAENARLRRELAASQAQYTERTRQLLAQNYYIIHENIEYKRRRQR